MSSLRLQCLEFAYKCDLVDISVVFNIATVFTLHYLQFEVMNNLTILWMVNWNLLKSFVSHILSFLVLSYVKDVSKVGSIARDFNRQMIEKLFVYFYFKNCLVIRRNEQSNVFCNLKFFDSDLICS